MGNGADRVSRVALYGILIFLGLLFVLPIYVMGVNSLKPLDEIRGGNLMALPMEWTLEPWATAWSTAQIGVQPTGLKPYFLNSFLLVVPAVLISTVIGAINGYILTQFKMRGANIVFAMLLFSVFIPFQIVLIPMARTLGMMGLAGTVSGLVFVNVVYGIGFTTLFFRNYYAAFPGELVRSARMDGAGFFRLFWRILLPNSGPIIVVTIIWQFTNIWNEFLFGATTSRSRSRWRSTTSSTAPPASRNTTCTSRARSSRRSPLSWCTSCPASTSCAASWPAR
jgi:glucose/mannose transport system permease protein